MYKTVNNLASIHSIHKFIPYVSLVDEHIVGRYRHTIRAYSF